jgi:outer membrane protein OmpA-like peptidoglycan-associated protein
MKKLLLCILIVVVPLVADFKRTSGLIDIPTARILPHFGYRIGADLTAQLGPGDYDQVVEENLHSSLGIGNFLELYFDVYTIIETWTVAGGFCHRLYGSDKFGLAWGIHGFSTLSDISEIGQTVATGWYDDQLYQRDNYDKPYERFSAYMVSTYALTNKIDVSVGLGRGRYVGYGSVSKYLNTNFYHEQGGDWGVGLFGGVEYKLTDRTSFMLEGDGRDVNAGIRFQPLPWEFGVALTKMEYFFNWDEYRPRVAVSASYKRIPKKPGPGIIAGTVYDTKGNALVAAVRTSDDAIPFVMTEPEFGAYKFTEVKPNLYEVAASADGYKTEKKKVDVLPEETVYCDFILEKLIGGIIGKVVDAKTDEPLIAQVAVQETDLSAESDVAGAFAFAELEPDDYVVNAKATGYVSGSAAATVESGKTADVLIRLMPITFTLEGIQFDFDKSTLRPQSLPILDAAAEILKQYPDIHVEIQGHTCWLGSDEYNLRLSDARANSVLNYLVTKQMIDRARLVAKGYGESQPIASNETREGRERNRRVEFHIIK